MKVPTMQQRSPLLLLVAALSLAALPIAAQEPQERVAAQLQYTQQNRMYIAVDKPLYYPGETVWFKAWEVSAKTLQPARNGYGLTVQLLDPKGGVFAEKRVDFAYSHGHNDFVIPESAAGGEYVIAATSDTGATAIRPVLVSTYEPPQIKKTVELERKAYGPGDEVTAKVKLERATGEPLANFTFTAIVNVDSAEVGRAEFTTDAQGKATVSGFILPQTLSRGDGLLTITVDDAGLIESTQKRINITLDTLDLSLFPEGGDLVQGLSSRVYFRAKTPLGKPADIDAEILEDGKAIGTVRSFHQGMGRFLLTPKAGKTYALRIIRPKNIVTVAELPEARAQGCVMRSIDDFKSERDTLDVEVRCTDPQSVTATAVLRDQPVGHVKADIAKDQPNTLSLPVSKHAQGAVRVTLWNNDAQPLAERLVYRGLSSGLTFDITTDQETYAPRDKVTVTLTVTDGKGEPVQGRFAFSVVDDTVLNFADDKTAHILAAILLEPEMPGQKIEEPNFYFDPEEEKGPEALDLVLGTQGWRRFTWQWVNP